MKMFLAVMLAATAVQAGGKKEVFNAPLNTVWAATIAVVSEEYMISSADRESGLILFRAGICEASVLVTGDEIATTLMVDAKATHRGLGIGLGFDAKRVKNRILTEVRKRLTER